MACLDDNLIAAYASGAATAAERALVVAHLDGCPTCLTVVCEVVRTGATADPGAGQAGPPPIERDTEVGRYQLREMIGRGGMGAVYRAHDPQLDRRIAIKVVRSQAREPAAILGRLAGEARTMARVRHPNVVAVYDSGELDDGVFIAMELIEGETLRAWQARPGRTWREVVGVYADVGRGLAAAHAAEVVHRDFKPDNVLVDGAGRAAVTDFGIARAGADDGDGGLRAGTPRYMAPEQLAGAPCDARSDQWSFAVALWEALYGEPPFAGRGLDELRAQIEGGTRRAPPRTTAVPAAIARALERALSIERGARWPSMDALVAALSAAARPARRRWAIALGGALAAAVLIAAGVVGFGLTRDRPAPTAAAPAAPTAHTVVVIAPFANTTGDPRLDDVLDAAVAEVLARSDTLDPLAGLDLAYAAARLGLAPTDADAVARAIAARDARPAVVVRGAVARAGRGFAVTLTGPGPGPALRESVASDALLLPATARLTTALARALGDDPGPVPALVSTSIDAIHETRQGIGLATTGDLDGAAARLRHALALDPADLHARITLGLVLGNQSAQPQAIAELERAIADGERLPARTRLLLLGDYHALQGQYVEAISAYQRYLARWPGDQRTEINLVAIAIDAGDFALAHELAAHAAAAHPDLAVVRGNYLLTLVATGRLDEAEREGAALRRDFAQPPVFAIAAAAIGQTLRGDPAAAQATWSALAELDAELADQGRADLALYQGRLADARALVQPYVERALAAGRPHDAEHELLLLAAIELAAGDRAAAARAATAAMGTGAVRPDYLAASLALAAGAPGPATEAAAAWEASPVRERQLFARLLAGDLARARGDAGAAVAAYRDATKLGSSWLARARLGLGQLAAGDAAAAAGELGWCVEHRGEAGLFMTPTLFLLAEVERALVTAGADRR